jgi:thioredoxin 1
MATSADVIEVDDATFDEEVLASKVPVLVDFGAQWCPPCRALAPIVARVASETAGRVKVVTVDTDASPRVAQRYGIRGVPTLLVFRQGEKTAAHVGIATREKVLALLER